MKFSKLVGIYLHQKQYLYHVLLPLLLVAVLPLIYLVDDRPTFTAVDPPTLDLSPLDAFITAGNKWPLAIPNAVDTSTTDTSSTDSSTTATDDSSSSSSSFSFADLAAVDSSSSSSDTSTAATSATASAGSFTIPSSMEIAWFETTTNQPILYWFQQQNTWLGSGVTVSTSISADSLTETVADNIFAAVEITEDGESTARTVSYSIRMRGMAFPSTTASDQMARSTQIYPDTASARFDPASYWATGFVALQNAIDQAILADLANPTRQTCAELGADNCATGSSAYAFDGSLTLQGPCQIFRYESICPSDKCYWDGSDCVPGDADGNTVTAELPVDCTTLSASDCSGQSHCFTSGQCSGVTGTSGCSWRPCSDYSDTDSCQSPQYCDWNGYSCVAKDCADTGQYCADKPFSLYCSDSSGTCTQTVTCESLGTDCCGHAPCGERTLCSNPSDESTCTQKTCASNLCSVYSAAGGVMTAQEFWTQACFLDSDGAGCASGFQVNQLDMAGGACCSSTQQCALASWSTLTGSSVYGTANMGPSTFASSCGSDELCCPGNRLKKNWHQNVRNDTPVSSKSPFSVEFRPNSS